MLKICYGAMPGAIYDTSRYFDRVYQNTWLSDPFAQEVIEALDQGTVLGTNVIDSRTRGVIPVTQLSVNVKTVLLIYNEPGKVFNVTACSDECAKFILNIGRKKDITINLYHIMNFGPWRFKIEILNSHTIVHSMRELRACVGEFFNGGDLRKA